jgi:hypothetical protein
MPRSRSRSRSPRVEERRRSRSPDGDRDRPRKSHGGFRWKDAKRRDDSRHADDGHRLERGHRGREDRARSPRRDRNGDRFGDRYRDGTHDRRRGDDREARPQISDRENRKDEGRKPMPEKKPPVSQPSEPMIIVHVNDRLGTKAAIPCLASDPISECNLRALTGGDILLLDGQCLMFVLQNSSKPRSPRALDVSLTKYCSNDKGNAHSRIFLRWKITQFRTERNLICEPQLSPFRSPSDADTVEIGDSC